MTSLFTTMGSTRSFVSDSTSGGSRAVTRSPRIWKDNKSSVDARERHEIHFWRFT